ncbi:MAG: hypothetical protein JWN44_4177 [Myxococcales bacterium]|nr:hypothetical protein [Myxococcales bacterium]
MNRPAPTAAAVAAVAVVGLACAGALVAGCAHSHPKGHFDAAAGKVCAGQVCYTTGALPSGWRLVHQEGASIGFFNEAVGAVIEANATCRDDAEAAPLPTLTRQLLIGYTDRKIEKQETVPLAEREALRTRVDAKLDGVPMALDLYVLKRNGCIFDLSYAAPPDAFARGSGDFARFVDGFSDARKEAKR